MSRPTPPVPVTWRDLFERHRESAKATLQYALDPDPSDELEDADLVEAFPGRDAVLARGVIFGGTAFARPLIELWHPLLPRLAAALQPSDLRERVAQEVVNFALVCECAGAERPEELDSRMLQALLAHRDEISDALRRSMAFTALALGDPATARAFLDAPPATYAQPNLRFEFNLYELIRYLADAIERRRPADEVEPAWVEYLELFPFHLAADAAAWPDLFCMARALADLRGEPVRSVADDLHARIVRLAS